MPLNWFVKTVVTSGTKAAIDIGANEIINRRREASLARAASNTPQRHYYTYNYNYNTTTSDDVKKDLNSCLSHIREGIEILQKSLDRISYRRDVEDERAKRTVGQELSAKADILATILREIFAADVGRWKSIARQSFSWAEMSFREAREYATRAFNNQKLGIDDRILAAKIRILSAIFGCVEDPETAATACGVYLEELNRLPNISEEFSRHFQRINVSSHERNSMLLFNIFVVNYLVYYFTEALSIAVLNVENWPRLRVSDVMFVHPIRSIGLRTLTMGIDYSEYGLHPKSISFSEPIDANDLAVNSVGDFIVAGLDRTDSKSPVVNVYSKFGEYRFAISPTEEAMKGAGLDATFEFHPCAVFTDEGDNIYVHTKPGHGEEAEENAALFVFNKEGNLQRVLSIECGVMALEKKSGKIFISNKKGVFVHKNTGQLLNSFATPEALQGSDSPIALCLNEDTIVLILANVLDANVYLLTETGLEIRQFQVKHAKGWKYIEFNPISGEIVVSYLSKELSHFELESYIMNGQALGRIHLPDQYPSHPRALTVTPSGRLAILYENIVHVI